MLDAVQQEKFREFLRTDLINRTRQNPKYSLRSYAKLLKIQSSFLSKLINGKRNITPQTIERFGAALDFSPHVTAQFLGRETKSAPIEPTLNPLAEDAFAVIADWYHFAILELFTIDGFLPTSTYIARNLGITKIEALDALARLERLKLIRKDRIKGYRLVQGENTTTQFPGSSVALRKLQKQVLSMALSALDEVPVTLRDQSTMTMAIDSSLLPEAKEKIKNFRRELCAFLQKKQRGRNSVYQLSLSLYPVTKFSNKETLI